MAAFAVETIKYTDLFNALLKSNGGFLNFLNRSPKLSPNAGAISARITTAVTLQTPADGTMLANNAARTSVALTAFNGIHTISLFDYELDQFSKDPSATVAEVEAFASAARVQAETEVLADLVAGTPGATYTNAAGTMDFTNLDTDAKAYVAMGKITSAIAWVQANCAGNLDGNVCILASQAAYGGLLAMRYFGRLAGDFERVNGQWSVMGYPIEMTTVTTNFGGASKDTLYVIHRDAEALVWSDVVVPHEEFVHCPDGLWKKYLKCYGFAGLIQANYAAVANTTS